MADQSDDRIKPWTIKGIGNEARNAAIAAADRERQTIGEWLTRAIRAQAQADHQRDRAPVALGLVRPEVDLSEIERTVAMIRELAESGAPPPKGVSRLAYGLLREHLAGMRGPTRSRFGPTKTATGPTEATDGPTKSRSGPTDGTNGQTDRPAGQTESPFGSDQNGRRSD